MNINVGYDFLRICVQGYPYKHAYIFEGLQSYDQMELRIQVRISEKIWNVILNKHIT
jgi:hypothetical protein